MRDQGFGDALAQHQRTRWRDVASDAFWCVVYAAVVWACWRWWR